MYPGPFFNFNLLLYQVMPSHITYGM
jgi:hypothetical protein